MTAKNFPINFVIANPYQTRLADDQAHIESLAADIERNGLLQTPIGRLSADHLDHVELAFGHSRLAGEVSEQVIAGAGFIRVDVPEVDGQPAFTKFYGDKAIYSITPVDEATARHAVAAWRPRPVDAYILPGLPAPVGGDDDFDGAPDDDDDDEGGF